MIKRINLWGNSLGLKKGAKVKMTLDKGKLVNQPAGKATLKALVGQITPDNSYERMDFGQVEGREVW